MVRDVNIDSVAFDRSAAVFRNVSMSIDYNYASVRNDTRIYCNGTSRCCRCSGSCAASPAAAAVIAGTVVCNTEYAKALPGTDASRWIRLIVNLLGQRLCLGEVLTGNKLFCSPCSLKLCLILFKLTGCRGNLVLQSSSLVMQFFLQRKQFFVLPCNGVAILFNLFLRVQKFQKHVSVIFTDVLDEITLI